MYRVIIADDEPLIRAGLYYRNPWKEMGFEVVAMLEDGEDVLKLLKEQKADVLLTDICMLQVSGLEVASVIREKYPWMKVVLLSGYQEFEYAREAIRCQVCEYLLKPIDYERVKEVFSVIKAELDESNHEERLLQCMGEEAYDQILALTKAVTYSVLGEGEETWLTYARLKPMLHEAPEEVREILLKRLLGQLKARLLQKDAALAAEFSDQLLKLPLNNTEESQLTLIELFRELNDKLVAKGLVEAERPTIDDSIAKACNYINNHLGDDFTYRDVAAFVHISPRHFTRRFHSEMKETFVHYLARVRIEAAQRLLDEGKIDLADVAAAVGYHDEKYFQQIFKKQVGCTMREYRFREGRSL